MSTATTGCACGSQTTVTDDTAAADTEACSCGCCGAPEMTLEEEIAELHKARAAIDDRLSELSANAANN